MTSRYDAVKIIITTPDDIHKHATESDMVVVQFHRSDIKKGLTGSALHTLMTISDSPELSRLYGGRLMFFFEGYDQDRREIIEIPECRRFFRKITNQWPFWFHFVVKEPQQFALVFTLLCDVKVKHRTGYSDVGFKNIQQFAELAHDLFGHMNNLYDLHGFSEEMNRKTSKEVDGMLMAMAGGKAKGK